MAVIPIWFKMPYKEQPLSTQNVTRPSDRGSCYCSSVTDGFSFYSQTFWDRHNRLVTVFPSMDLLTKAKRKAVQSHLQSTSQNYPHRENLSMILYASESSRSEKQLRLLDSYLGRQQIDENQMASGSSNPTSKSVDGSGEINAKDELQFLSSYLAKLNEGDEESAAPSRASMELKSRIAQTRSEMSPSLRQHDETSGLYLISVLASINIAVFLFEIASPVRNSDFELYSLPLLYGAKINQLILVGEWWRLMTPMFLHSGLLHIALGCWALLSFGPQVCRVYGSLTFFLIYILGGLSGNLTSFFHTAEPAVGGTGPVFAIIGAWLIYQIQNKDVIARDEAESMFQKAIIITALSFLLSNFGPIDVWTHTGAAFTGIIYGFFTCPTLQLDDASSGSGQEEGITLVGRYADPCKSLILFTVFLLILSSLVFFIEPPLSALSLDDVV